MKHKKQRRRSLRRKRKKRAEAAGTQTETPSPNNERTERRGPPRDAGKNQMKTRSVTTALLLLLLLLAAGAPAQQPETRWRGVRVADESARAGYQRPDWDVRDTEIHRLDGSPPCTPYTRTPITYVGPGDGLDREHIVALAEAWDSRPPGFGSAHLRALAEDHANLTLADAATNRSKSARDAAEWRPRHNGAWMAHRVIEVKRRYGLSVDPAERDALERLLASGPDRITCDSPTPAATAPPRPAPTAAAHPPVQRYRNCATLRRAGWDRGVRRGGGSYRDAWDDAERRTYALNTGRDGDGDGHACE